MSFTPCPHIGSTWWIRRLPATTRRANLLARSGAPLLRTLAPGESFPAVVTLGPADHALLAARDARESIGGGR